MSEHSIAILGLDTGNGYIKGGFLGQEGKKVNVDMPSCVAGLPQPPQLPQVVSDTWMNDIFNNMQLQFHSPLVRDNRYLLFGGGAIRSGRSLIEFDIATTNLSKAQQDLSVYMTLGTATGVAIRNYWFEHHDLPHEILDVDVYGAYALPIDEYFTHYETFSQKFLNTVHEVTLCNFTEQVHVRLTFKSAHVAPEGVSAQYAISSKGEAFAQALLDDIRSRDMNALPGITAHDIATCVNTCGIDIGEGTVNMPVLKNGQFNAIASTTLQKGYGSVLEQSLPRIAQANMPYDSRKKLADFMLAPETAFNRNKKATVHDIVASEAVDLVDAICREISKVLSGGGVELIYVYGGGATPLKPFLYDKLVEKASSFSGGDAFPILYLDSSYARNLNREGLYEVAMSNYKYLTEKEKKAK